MPQVIIRFLKPDNFIGAVTSWRLAEPYSHAVVIAGGSAYSATLPRTVKRSLDHKHISYEYREGVDVIMQVTEQQLAEIIQWCESQLGAPYDFISILGWINYFKGINSARNKYCFEFCRDALAAAGIVKIEPGLLTGEALLINLFRARCTCGAMLS